MPHRNQVDHYISIKYVIYHFIIPILLNPNKTTTEKHINWVAKTEILEMVRDSHCVKFKFSCKEKVFL